MRLVTHARPSPALVVAIVALVAAAGGTAVAGPVANKGVSKGKAKKIADKEIDAKASGLSVAHAGTADSANSANSATTANTANNASTVNNLSASEIDVRLANDTANTAFDGSGLKLTAICTGNQIAVLAKTSKSNASIYTSVVDTDSNNNNTNDDLESGGFGPTNTFDLLAGNDGNPGLVHFEFDANDGSSVRGIISVDEGGNPVCQAHGHVLAI